jgi:hypothetical protein
MQAITLSPRVWSNRLANPCAGGDCDEFVQRNEGVVIEGAQKGKWVTLCARCAEARGLRVPGGEHIELSLFGRAQVVVRVNRYLGHERFDLYKDVLAQVCASYDVRTQVTLVHREKAEHLAAMLRDKGLTVREDDAVRAMLDALSRRRVSDAANAVARVDTLEERLGKRGLKLYPFQHTGVEWLAPRDRALLCDEMGLGKTIQALVALPSADKKLGKAGPPVLVVCKGMGKAVWERELGIWRPDLRPIVLEGRDSFIWPKAGELVITNYDILPPVEDLSAAPPPECVVIADEAQAVKNAKAKRTIRFRAIGEMTRNAGGRTWVLTGTPLMNRLSELWAMLQAAGLGSEAFGTRKRFKEMCGCTEELHPCKACGHISKHADKKGCLKCIKAGKECHEPAPSHTVWGQPSPEVSAAFQRVALRRRRRDVLPDLPGKHWQDHPVKLAKEAHRQVDAELAPGWEDAIEDALATQGGVDFKTMSSARRALAEAKVGAALEMAEDFADQDEPLVAFSCHTAPLEALGALDKWAVLDGRTSEKERTGAVNAFQAGELNGIAANITVASTSITLTRACHCLFVDQAWSPSDNEQAEDRLARIGQKRGVLVHRLVADHALDRRVCELLDVKRQLIAAALEGKPVERAPA